VALTAADDNSSNATNSTATLPVNNGSPHTVAVNYIPGDKNFVSGSGSLAAGQKVMPASLTVTANSQTTSYSGVPVTAFSAKLSGFVNGETEAGLRSTGSLSGAPGFAGSAIAGVNAGQYTITPTLGTLAAANYNFPTANFIAGTLTILKANTTSLTTGLVSPLNDPVNGAAYSFVVIVSSTTGGTPTGAVQFADDKNINLTSQVSLNPATCPPATPAIASCAKFSPAMGQLSLGSQTITATYQGDGNFNSTSSGSTASSVEVTITSAIETSPGQVISPQIIAFDNAAAFAGQNISLSCLVQAATIPSSPDFPTCSLSSTALSTSGSVTVTIGTVGSSSVGFVSHPSTSFLGRATGAFPYRFSAALSIPAFALAGLMLAGIRSSTGHNRRPAIVLGLVLMLIVLLVLSGCGGSAGSVPSSNRASTAVGTYLVSIVGTDANHNQVLVATIPLHVQ
jgi:hypothetical protein